MDLVKPVVTLVCCIRLGFPWPPVPLFLAFEVEKPKDYFTPKTKNYVRKSLSCRTGWTETLRLQEAGHMADERDKSPPDFSPFSNLKIASHKVLR